MRKELAGVLRRGRPPPAAQFSRHEARAYEPRPEHHAVTYRIREPRQEAR
jgi:hypothetical protein